MRDFKYIWAAGLGVTLLVIAVPIWLFGMPVQASRDNPWEAVPQRAAPTNHAALINGEFATGQDVTRACLTCHEDAGEDMLHNVHFRWVGDPVQVAGRDEPVAIGKANLLNNFCLGVQSNWTSCTRCHAGYGWSDASYDFGSVENVDCLVCHDQSNGYAKAASGNPAEGVDLLAAARSVGTPTRVNCGGCHFNGGGGNGVKHGDLDESLYFPSENLDVHMGRYQLQCVDCHQTEDHLIRGRAMSVSVESTNQVYCTDCHTETLHPDDRITAHLGALACQTCHIPAFAMKDATKISWDWSTAGQDLPEDPHEYLKIKGSFVYENDVQPTYAWFNGTVSRYLLGDVIDPTALTVLNQPLGDITDPQARIYPFKIHLALQPYDRYYLYLLQPNTVGENGYWATFDWNQALINGARATGLPYSGSPDFGQVVAACEDDALPPEAAATCRGFGFAPTAMYWVTTHMVQPAENALQCADCHGESTRFDWQALGYYGDPMTWGGRDDAAR